MHHTRELVLYLYYSPRHPSHGRRHQLHRRNALHDPDGRPVRRRLRIAGHQRAGLLDQLQWNRLRSGASSGRHVAIRSGRFDMVVRRWSWHRRRWREELPACLRHREVYTLEDVGVLAGEQIAALRVALSSGPGAPEARFSA